MIKWLEWIGARGTIIMSAGIIIGLAFPAIAALARPFISPLIFVMLVTTMMQVDLDQFKDCLTRPLLLILALLWMLIASPLLVLGLMKLGLGAWLTPGLALALILTAGAPVINSTPSLAAIMRLNTGLALALLVCGMFAAPFTLYFLVGLLDIGKIPFTPLEMFTRMSAMILGAMFIGSLLRLMTGQARLIRYAGAINGFYVLMLIGFGIGIMDKMTIAIMSNPGRMALMAALGFGVCAAMLVTTTVLFFKTSRMTAATIGFGASLRQIGVIGGALGTLLPQDAWFFIAMIQFPIYLMPALLKPLYDRWVHGQEKLAK